ncbi:methane monooxygenase subunit A, gamma chain [Methylocaldum marinum]|uniref:Methane monooxygenase subunit A, gamma chain n=1 Tax=Methylocaldum marinum TaxID=1432792 RepID=A0A250KMF8_9GAMM|nr:methane monooxygenase [Methylocaldum marinum]BBA32732.1 methane monooxygenase subunit A, gamma chain [Methylocaldum marinum]
MANYPVHDNPVRDAWMDKIGKLNKLDKAVEFLKDFRLKHTTPLRTTYELELDYLWIENRIEEKVAQLKAHAFTDQQFLEDCATGESARAVAESWLAKINACTDKWAAEKVHIQFRQLYKPPVMPVNYFMDADRQLGSRLMELRDIDYYDTPLETLRKQRGVKVVHLQPASVQ